jgi:glycosyltransferase involved in cell wall biosynthesis
LRDLALTYNIAPELMIFERGLPFKELYALYAISDVFLLTSKAEGLCMPVMEAMSVGVPVVATNCGALPELLGTEYPWQRGFLMETEYSMIDPWGNSRRDFPKADSGIQAILDIVSSESPLVAPNRARIYMEERTWEKPLYQIAKAIEELDEQK